MSPTADTVADTTVDAAADTGVGSTINVVDNSVGTPLTGVILQEKSTDNKSHFLL